MYIVKRRIYGTAADGRAVLLYTPGTRLTDEQARRAGLVAGEPAPPPGKKRAPSRKKPREAPRGLIIHDPSQEAPPEDPQPEKPLSRMILAELRAVCEAEGIDAGGANLRAEYIEVIEAAYDERAAEGEAP